MNNDRRIFLINKKYKEGSLTAIESQELDILQKKESERLSKELKPQLDFLRKLRDAYNQKED